MIRSTRDETDLELTLQTNPRELIADADRSDALSLYLKARALHRIGRRTEAVSACREAGQLRPNDPLIESFQVFLETAIDLSALDSGLTRLKRIADQAEFVAPRAWLVRLLLLARDGAGARGLADALLQQHPSNCLVAETVALVRYADRDYAQALALLSRVPSSPEGASYSTEQVRLVASLHAGQLAEARDAYSSRQQLGTGFGFPWLLPLWPYRASAALLLGALAVLAVALSSWLLAALVTVGAVIITWGFGWDILRSWRAVLAGTIASVAPWVGIAIRESTG